MNADLWSAAVNLLAAGNAFSAVQTQIEAASAFPSTGEGTLMGTSKDLLLSAAIQPPANRPNWYLLSSPFFSAANGSPGVTAPNGPFGTSPWTATSLTLTGGQADAAGGTLASLVTLTAATAQHKITRSFAGSTFGLYVKAGTAHFIGLSFSGGTNAQVYNLSTGALSTVVGTVVASISPLPAAGWYVLTYTEAAGSTLTISFGDTAAHAVPGTSWTAAGTETFDIYNAQGA